MWQSIADNLEDPCARVVVAPYLARAEAELAVTRFASLLSAACQETQLANLAQTLWTHAEDAVARLVAARLARENPLWGLDVRLAPSADVVRVRKQAADVLADDAEGQLVRVAPLLGAELERQTHRFVAVSLETCERIWGDRRAIAAELLGVEGDELLGRGGELPGGGSELLGGGGELGLITALNADLADCHDGGRRTTVVTCEAGRFVYKPHDCRIDVWFKEVAEQHMPRVLVQPRTLLRADATGAWAFQEFMERRPVADEASIARFWRNTGRAWALFQALGSEDLHCENFVAAGECPSLIDCETVITSEPAMRGDPITSPNFGYASRGFGRDVAGTLFTSSLLPSPVWPPAEGTERGMAPVNDTSPLLARGKVCLPVLNGEECDVRGYEDELLAGLEEGLAALTAHADALAADVCAADDIPVRRLIRDTSVYALLLARMRRADAYEPAVREGLLDALHRPLVRGQEHTRSPLATSEAACLVEGDVPYFYAAAGSREVVGSDGTADDRLLEASAVERALERIAKLDKAHNAFALMVVRANVKRAILPVGVSLPACEKADEPLSAEAALAEAERIFGVIERQAVASPSGEESWLFRDANKGVLGRSSVEFGGGLGGVAIFLAAFVARTTSVEVRDRALALLGGCLARFDEVVAVMEAARVVPESSVGLGLTGGLGGVVRSLDLVVRILGSEDDAGVEAGAYARVILARLLSALGKADIEGARQLDVYGGTAGLLLALAQCPLAAESDAARDVARRLVGRLEEARTLAAKDGRLLWDTVATGWPVSGFGHGQAGIAAALAAARASLGIDVGEAVRSALAWELSSYSEALGTWPDLRRSPVSGKMMHGICSGAPGIGLAALAVARASNDCDVRALASDLLDRADGVCLTRPLNPRDIICCGNSSIAEYLVSRGFVQDAGCVLAGMQSRARKLGHYVLHPLGTRPVDEPDLLHGLSGVGYELLRYAAPELPGAFVG